MSNVIYIKDILLKKDIRNKKTSGRPKLKPFDQETVKIKKGMSRVRGIAGVAVTEKNRTKKQKTVILRSSLTEQQKIKNEK